MIADDTAVAPRIVDVQGIPMSALVAEARRPRAVVVALHGGASTSRYFDCPDRPRLSLLRAGVALGFTVVALDRPGYGSSLGYAERMGPPARRVELAYAAVDKLLASRSRGAGVFLLAHSIGCELGLRMATDGRGAELLGVELAGTGRQHHPAARDIMQSWQLDPEWPRRTSRTGLRELLWHPAHLYPDELVGGARIAAPGPAYEAAVVERWAAYDFPELAAKVTVPVHFTLGDHERVWRSGPAALAELAALFGAAPRVAVHEQARGGHNLSLGLTALAYHLTVLSFVEECVVDAARSGRR
ncbi:MAG TPA: alpha/beta fold hydrolase [Rugosimonospora sp.]|nr:alpha/beta fold hydrolase [Rugosimonospora sp.]